MKQQKKQSGITVFYSYASADREWRDSLATHLSQLKRDGLIEEWYDQEILGGEEHSLERDRMLRSAQIILLLVSADFLASDTCYHIEMQRALEYHKRGEVRVVPIIVRPCDWQHSPFAYLRCLPRNMKPIMTWDNHDEAFLSIAEELRLIIEKQQFPSPWLSNLQRKNRVRLLKRVRSFWITGLLDQSLHQAAWLDLHLQDQPDALENPWRLQVQELNQAPCLLPSGTSIAQVYDEADGELLILGEPGSGKTTLLLQLARMLLDRALADERFPMPVVFHLSSWGQKQKSLATWLVDELNTKYRIPRRVGWRWIRTNQMLLLFDGLDEVAEEARMACVRAITAYYRRQEGAPLVICCRNKEYQALSVHLPLQRAVSILPLTGEQIDEYLASTQGQLEGLRQVLGDDAELYELAHRPLMLSIFTLAFQGVASADLPAEPTREQTLHAVFESYVKRMFARRGQLQRWTPEQFLRWLIYVAKQLHRRQQTVFSVKGLQPDWLPPKQQRLYRWSLLILGSVQIFYMVSVLSPVLWKIVSTTASSLSGCVMAGILIMPVYALIAGLSGSKLTERTFGLVEWLVGENKRPFGQLVEWLLDRRLLLFSLLVGGLVGTLSADLDGINIKLYPEMLHGGVLDSVLCSMLFVGVPVIWVGIERLIADIGRSWKSGLVVAELLFTLETSLLFIAVSTLLGGLAGALSGMLVFGSSQVLAFVLAFVLTFVMMMMVIGSSAIPAIAQNTAAFLWLCSTKYLPWNYVAFLDEAAERLLLRKVGDSYIFVHRLLLEYFSTLNDSVDSKSI